MQLVHRPLVDEDFLHNIFVTISSPDWDTLNDNVARAIPESMKSDIAVSRYYGVFYSDDDDVLMVRPSHADSVFGTGRVLGRTWTEWIETIESSGDDVKDYALCFCFDAEKGMFVTVPKSRSELMLESIST